MQEHVEQDPTGTSLRADPLLTDYLNRPLLLPHLQRVWDMFWRLSRRRPVGFALGAIPLTEFAAYCAMLQVNDPVEREWLFKRIDALDEAYIEAMNDRHAENKK